MKLTREIRMFLGSGAVGTNSWAGTSSSEGLGAFWRLRATVQGPVDPVTGYVCDVQEIDSALRNRVAANLLSAWSNTTDIQFSHTSMQFNSLGHAMLKSHRDLSKDLKPPLVLDSIELRPSPFTWFAVHTKKLPMLTITQTFEFSAAHRLHCSSLPESENRRIFGKCANPNGHGHNYVLEVSVECDTAQPTAFPFGQFDRIVKELVIDRFDHKHLNLDCPEFAALNPSVENIARVIWGLLVDRLAPLRLCEIRVWETPKTSATYDGTDS